jgi:hypothetical protein
MTKLTLKRLAAVAMCLVLTIAFVIIPVAVAQNVISASADRMSRSERATTAAIAGLLLLAAIPLGVVMTSLLKSLFHQRE